MSERKDSDNRKSFSERWHNFNTGLFFSHEVSGVSSISMKRIMRGRVSKLWNYLGRSIAYTSARSYGCFALAFGLLSLFLHLGEYYFRAASTVEFSSLLIGAALVLISIPLLLVKRPMCLIFQDIALTDYIFFEFFSITRMPMINSDSTPISPLLALFLGFIPAIAGFFLPLHYVVVAIFLCIFVAIAFMSPEFPMILTLLALPYCYFIDDPELILACLSLLTLLSYARKVLLGKRVYNFRINDVILFVMMIFIIISGATGKGENALFQSFKVVAVMLSYIPCANLIVNRRLADCAVHAVIVSSVPVAIFAVIEFIAEHPAFDFQFSEMSTPGTSSLFASPTTLSAFLLVSGFFSFSFAIQNKRHGIRALYTLISMLDFAAMGLTMQPAAWLSAILAIIAYFVIKSHRIRSDVLFFVVVIVHLALLIPTGFLDTVMGVFSVSRLPSEFINGLSETFAVFKKYVFFGVGYGDGAFFIASGGDVGEFNLLLGIASMAGVVVLSLFIFMMLLYFRQIAFFRSYFSGSLVKTTGRMAFLSIFSLLIFGAGANIFFDKSMMYLFFATLGIGSAILHRAKKESEDRMGYYGDSASIDTSMLDIGLK